jgi:hypothetical protein
MTSPKRAFERKARPGAASAQRRRDARARRLSTKAPASTTGSERQPYFEDRRRGNVQNALEVRWSQGPVRSRTDEDATALGWPGRARGHARRQVTPAEHSLRKLGEHDRLPAL